MKKQRFDNLVCLLGDGSSRRRFFGLVITGGFGVATSEPVKGRRKTCRKLRCTECAPCNRGQCRPKPDGTPCSYMNGQCEGGLCVPPS
jgi:hypothetical protein